MSLRSTCEGRHVISEGLLGTKEGQDRPSTLDLVDVSVLVVCEEDLSKVGHHFGNLLISLREVEGIRQARVSSTSLHVSISRPSFGPTLTTCAGSLLSSLGQKSSGRRSLSPGRRRILSFFLTPAEGPRKAEISASRRQRKQSRDGPSMSDFAAFESSRRSRR